MLHYVRLDVAFNFSVIAYEHSANRKHRDKSIKVNIQPFWPFHLLLGVKILLQRNLKTEK